MISKKWNPAMATAEELLQRWSACLSILDRAMADKDYTRAFHWHTEAAKAEATGAALFGFLDPDRATSADRVMEVLALSKRTGDVGITLTILLTQLKPAARPRSPLEDMIDRACGFDPDNESARRSAFLFRLQVGDKVLVACSDTPSWTDPFPPPPHVQTIVRRTPRGILFLDSGEAFRPDGYKRGETGREGWRTQIHPAPEMLTPTDAAA